MKNLQTSFFKDESYNYPLIIQEVELQQKKEARLNLIKLSTSDLEKTDFSLWCRPIQTGFLLKTYPSAQKWILNKTQQNIKLGQLNVFKTVLNQWQEETCSAKDPGTKGLIQIHFMNHIKYLLADHKYNPSFMDVLWVFSKEKKYNMFDPFFKTYLQGIMVSRNGSVTDIPKNSIEETFQNFMSLKTCFDLYKESGSTKMFWYNLFELIGYENGDVVEQKFSFLKYINGKLGNVILRKDEVPVKYSYGKAQPSFTKTKYSPATSFGEIRSFLKISKTIKSNGLDDFDDQSWFLREIKRKKSQRNLTMLLNFCSNYKKNLKISSKMGDLVFLKYQEEEIEIKNELITKNPLAIPDRWLSSTFEFFKFKNEGPESTIKNHQWTYDGKPLSSKEILGELRKRLINKSGKDKLRGVFNV